MKKKIIALACAMVLLLGMTSTVYAADSSVKYLGNNNFETNFAANGFMDTFSGMLPGDSREESVVLTNTSDKTVDFYMNTKVAKAFEDIEGIAGGAAYSVKLSVVKNGEETVVYGNGENAAVIGGNESGLNVLDSSLSDNLMVATLAKGESATVKLSIALEGESFGIDYNAANQDFERVTGELDFEFFVVEQEFNSSLVPNNLSASMGGITTGDYAPIATLITILAAAAAVIVVCVVVKGRRKNEQSTSK